MMQHWVFCGFILKFIELFKNPGDIKFSYLANNIIAFVAFSGRGYLKSKQITHLLILSTLKEFHISPSADWGYFNICGLILPHFTDEIKT